MSEILKPSSTVEFTPEDVETIVRGLCLVAPDWPLGLCGRAAILIQQQAAELAAAHAEGENIHAKMRELDAMLIAALKAKEAAKKLKSQLKEIEFASNGYCPACSGWEVTKGQGCQKKAHMNTCWLRAAIDEARKP